MRVRSKESEIRRGLRTSTVGIIGGLLALLIMAAAACDDPKPRATEDPAVSIPRAYYGYCNPGADQHSYAYPDTNRHTQADHHAKVNSHIDTCILGYGCSDAGFISYRHAISACSFSDSSCAHFHFRVGA